MHQISLVSGKNTYSLALNEVTVPAVKDDEIRVRIHASAINPIDLMLKHGIGQTLLMGLQNVTLPIVLGREFAGEVEKIGLAVSDFKIGDKVWGVADLQKKNQLESGAHSQYIVVNKQDCTLFPDNLTFQQAAGMPFAFLTLWNVLFDALNLEKLSVRNKRVLILGASGNVGSLALQMLKYMGAFVFASCSKNNFEYVKDLGADKIFSYKDQNYLNELHALDIILDFNGMYGGAATLSSLTGVCLSISQKKEISLLTNDSQRQLAQMASINPMDYFALLGAHESKLREILPIDLPAYVSIVTPLVADCDRFGVLKGIGSFLKNYFDVKSSSLLSRGCNYHYASFSSNETALNSLANLAARETLKPRPVEAFHYTDYENAFKRSAAGDSIAKCVLDFS